MTSNYDTSSNSNNYSDYYRYVAQRSGSSLDATHPFHAPPTMYPPLPDGSKFANANTFGNICGTMQHPPLPFVVPQIPIPPPFHFPHAEGLRNAVAARSLSEARNILTTLRNRESGAFGEVVHKGQDEQDLMGRTALHIAASLGHVEMIDLLLEFGCNTSIKDIYGRTPLELAKEIGSRYLIAMTALGGQVPGLIGTVAEQLATSQNDSQSEVKEANESPQSLQKQSLECVECDCGNVINLDEYAKKLEEEAEPLGLTFCPCGHQLKLRPRIVQSEGTLQHCTYICDQCESRSFTNEQSLRCALCDYDQCL